ncbi:brevican core protein-like [Haliotis rubra]|uniref:brevican core protein-like n=1 Tax=Haliotis rubra TaxID=36100 RepID=UPI001EE5B46B|nr:brevican core protein-like [Haliotis rubra]
MCQERGYTFLEDSLSCVKIYTRGSPWLKARRSCRNKGADLVTVKDETKQREVASFMMQYQTVWIGLHDQLHSNTFLWVDGSPLIYTAWEPGQPSHSFRWRQENCVQISHTQQKEPL